MSFMANRRDIGRTWTSVLVPNIVEKIKEIVAGIGGWTAVKSNDGVFEVHFGVNNSSSHKVDLVQRILVVVMCGALDVYLVSMLFSVFCCWKRTFMTTWIMCGLLKHTEMLIPMRFNLLAVKTLV
jgi:hypothetical protein